MTGKEAKERLQKQYKRQNNSIKENYDRISATLPKGTIDRIKALGLTINGVANDAILSFLECAEEVGQDATEEPQNVQEAAGQESADKLPARHPERQETPKTDTRSEAERLAEIQAIIDAKKAEMESQKRQKEEEQAKEKEEQAEELKNYVRKMKEEADQRRQEQIDRFSKHTDEEIKAFFCGDDLAFRDAIADPANKAEYIAEIGETNYNRCLKLLKEVEKEEKEQKRAETIAAAKFAEK